MGQRKHNIKHCGGSLEKIKLPTSFCSNCSKVKMEDEDKLLYGDDGGGGDKDDEPTQGGSGDNAQDEDTVTFPEENVEDEEAQNEFLRDAEEDEEEEEDDDVQIVIDQGKIEEAKTTATFGIKPSSRQIP